MNSKRIQKQIRWSAGLAASGMLVYMSFLSMSENYTLTLPVITGMLAVIVLLMYGTSELTSIIDSYHGNDYAKTPEKWRNNERD